MVLLFHAVCYMSSTNLKVESWPNIDIAKQNDFFHCNSCQGSTARICRSTCNWIFNTCLCNPTNHNLTFNCTFIHLNLNSPHQRDRPRRRPCRMLETDIVLVSLFLHLYDPLGLQIPTLFLLALVVGRRFNRDFKSSRGPRPEVKRTSDISNWQFARGIKFWLSLKRAAIWYLCGGNVAVGYGVMAAGQAALFALCLHYGTTDDAKIRQNL
jgi:hypothetical protein